MNIEKTMLIDVKIVTLKNTVRSTEERSAVVKSERLLIHRLNGK